MRLLLACVFVVWSGLAQAEVWPWGCVVYATHGEKSGDHRVTPYEKELGKIFGYTRHEVIGSAWATGPAHEESWVSPTKEFFLRIQPEPGGGAGVELFQHQKVVVKAKVKLDAQTPMFISGPEYREGRLVIVVRMKEIAPKK